MFLSVLFDKIWYFIVCFNQISDIKTQLWSFLWVDLPPGGRELYWALVSQSQQIGGSTISNSSGETLVNFYTVFLLFLLTSFN